MPSLQLPSGMSVNVNERTAQRYKLALRIHLQKCHINSHPHPTITFLPEMLATREKCGLHYHDETTLLQMMHF